MADEKLAKMLRIASNAANIRNIATSAHIHHGKTAFTDNLLAAAGLMKESAAGDLDAGMATWQHADEQERLMTVDAANVSMAHTFDGQDYLINLIDTPGHVDFGGNVTRAMRAVDGTVVLVCASEGIMPQTETVMKQALRERVKPVLFINKCDRLIKEMMFTPAQMQERFTEIILKFNKLIETLAEPEFKEKWKVDIMNGSVAFGSARDNWAMSVPFMQKKGVSFKDILNIYNLDEEAQKKWVWEKAPLYEVILDMSIKHLPDPKQAQLYRIPKIWRGDPESELGQDLKFCNPNGKLTFVVTRILVEPKSGREIAAGRLYSGTLKAGAEVYLTGDKTYAKVQNLYIYKGVKTEMIESIPSGNIVAIMGVKTRAGETISITPDVAFEEMKHIFEPVVTKAIKAKNPQDLPKLVEVLRQVTKEDPSVKVEINEETGEHLLHGMGELHLEIIENRMKTEKNVDIIGSPPIVVYRESVNGASSEVEGKSPNKHNKIYMKVEAMTAEMSKAIEDGFVSNGRVKKRDPVFWKALEDAGMESKETRQVVDIFEGNMLIDQTRGIVGIDEVMPLMIDGFEDVIKYGPLAREPCVNIVVRLTDVSLHEDAIHRGPAQMLPAVREAIRGAMMQARPVLFEPVQTLLLEAPVEYMGELTKLVTQKRGILVDVINEEESYVTVKGEIPVAETFGLSNDLRSATNGRGVQSMADQTFKKMNPELQQKVVIQLRERKKLSVDEMGVAKTQSGG
ncbi:MAG TPA: elongation factor EF-2 [Candidatus Nanoarchaeia archaeon]|nr:elongation factor EF-2 [Candidatus Nanoarchaeia archaeon]